MRRILATFLVAALVGAPTKAHAAERSPAAFEEGEQLAGNPWIPWAVALAVAIAIIVVVADSDDDPVSP